MRCASSENKLAQPVDKEGAFPFTKAVGLKKEGALAHSRRIP